MSESCFSMNIDCRLYISLTGLNNLSYKKGVLFYILGLNEVLRDAYAHSFHIVCIVRMIDCRGQRQVYVLQNVFEPYNILSSFCNTCVLSLWSS